MLFNMLYKSFDDIIADILYIFIPLIINLKAHSKIYMGDK